MSANRSLAGGDVDFTIVGMMDEMTVSGGEGAAVAAPPIAVQTAGKPDSRLEASERERISGNFLKEDEGKFRCRICDKLFKSQTYVENHILNKHPDIVRPSEAMEEGEVSAVIMQSWTVVPLASAEGNGSGWVWQGKVEPTTENSTVEGDLISRAAEGNFVKEGENKFRCGLCGKLFKTTQYVSKHIANRHPHVVSELEKREGSAKGLFRKVGEGRFPCSVCPMGFKAKFYVEQHVINRHPNKIPAVGAQDGWHAEKQILKSML